MAECLLPLSAIQKKATWERILDNLVVKERKRQARNATLSLLTVDSQGVKIVQFIEEQTGIDGNKCINVGPPVRA
ncbi:hypothetical protein [Spirosoma fluminis]